PEEIKACRAYVENQLDIIKPKVVVALGKSSAQTLLETDTPITALRGNFYPYRGAKLLPTYHPAYLLRNPSAKKEVWADMKKIAKELGIDIPKTKVN
ncbi:MAG: uracil-DNA glycosylase, partial [Candidatus Omnitrophica bacterium]|nr:uracil-DNA glycosylase [Candidatus Omnitrophota bacterium]